jgi:hypothetical protein
VPQPKDPQRDPHQRLRGDSDGIAAWRERMKTDEAKAIYQERASTAECVNAQARNRGLVRLLVRGLRKVKAIALWYAVAHNLRRGLCLRGQLQGVWAGKRGRRQRVGQGKGSSGWWGSRLTPQPNNDRPCVRPTHQRKGSLPLIHRYWTNVETFTDSEDFRDDDGNKAYTVRLNEAGALARFKFDIAVANETYAQVGVRIITGVTDLITAPAAVADGTVHVSVGKSVVGDENLTATEKAILLGGFNTVDPNDIESYYIVRFDDAKTPGVFGRRGRAFSSDYYQGMKTAE